MTIYQQVFGGSNIAPSEISYRLINLTSDITLTWPLESIPDANNVARIMDVVATNSGGANPTYWTITLPDARSVSVGETLMFNNPSANPFSVADNSGKIVVAPTPGNIWQLYLTDNSTAAGTWKSILYGAQASTANASALAGYGLSVVGNQLVTAMNITKLNSDYAPQNADRAQVFVWTGANGNINLPLAGTVANNWFVLIRNSGTGALNLNVTSPNTINGSNILVLQPSNSAIVVSDGINFFTIGLGQQAVFAFDYTSINISGTGDYVLQGGELNRIAYNFTGALTGNRNVVVPNTIQQYWVTNATTGAFTLTIKTATQTVPLAIPSDSRFITYCDGNNVVKADNQGISLPVTIAQGGTGATDATTARVNLGGTSVGISLYTAADAQTARTAINAASSDEVVAVAIALGG